MSKGKVKSVLFYRNGAVAAFDEDDKQIPELQRLNLYELWKSFAQVRGFDVSECEMNAIELDTVEEKKS